MKDLTGMIFGKWKVVERSKDNKGKIPKWYCECECGEKRNVNGATLRNGISKSCGCLNRQNLAGKRFGMIYVLEIDKSKKRKSYICKCDCGNVKSMREDVLLNNVKSCGCLTKEIRYLANKKYNKYDLSGEYGIGWTSNTNEEFYFDLEDYDLIKDYCWARNKDTGYIVTSKNYPIHRLIMDDKFIDHVDSNNSKHDNRKYNLRKCTNQQNQANRFEPSNNTSGHKGVIKYKNGNNIYWRAQVSKKPKQYTKSYSIITYGEEISYKMACDWVENKSIELYGEFSPYYKSRDIVEEYK